MDHKSQSPKIWPAGKNSALTPTIITNLSPHFSELNREFNRKITYFPENFQISGINAFYLIIVPHPAFVPNLPIPHTPTHAEIWMDNPADQSNRCNDEHSAECIIRVLVYVYVCRSNGLQKRHLDPRSAKNKVLWFIIDKLWFKISPFFLEFSLYNWVLQVFYIWQN